MFKHQKYTTFLRDLSNYLWRERELAHRCLDLKKLKNKTLPGGGDIVLCSPRKLDLYLSTFQDYLNESRYYKNLTDNEKDIMIKNSTESLSVAIRDARFLFMKKNRRRRTV
ncbi:hypothetical protein TSAR_015464 [Trichomalopsis sarcophagae]|uniref:Uncharacterized protein n=1 Tax=Trichomalopsis sarcophagae TaxID=543379 RepID=A0A232F007_9HYME|nr:hypothetical protein TSAR_015464 [Trichomalopsis sarcophagae]